MRVLIASGGTGGHFYPGLALARELGRRGHECLFVLRRGDPGGPRLDAEGLPWTELDLAGLSRRPSLSWLSVGPRTLMALKTAYQATRAWRPSVLVGMGGYLTLPAALAAAARRVPVVLHESNAVLGLANRLCAPFAAALALGLPREDGGEGTLVGTPLRAELHARGDAHEARRALGLDPALPTVLVLGGSQGARALNAAVPAAVAALKAPVQVLHLAGKNGAEAARAAYAAGPARAVVVEYLERMDRAYAAADLAVCRAGAGTAAELAAQSLPAVLVPYPHAAGGHQDVNARLLERVGAAVRIPEADLSSAALSNRLKTLLGDSSGRTAMGEAYAKLGLPSPKDCVGRFAGLVEAAGR
ncbi:MAG: UDP-N-acetylglucosamine--N-acetylmuramyl-(pentapeptide) pyrophosphoryl-undecaprenol N-acetylglucosamine transferase [Elusimicrobia bacterium]|nr:UDP-N-acetylglucosamine--N-acetylmuramyl-(pentapeptide) pyrophosphoryl-undecaprenol N-acetylglucosamine transferase [Elusimicrobiota bacterium]